MSNSVTTAHPEARRSAMAAFLGSTLEYYDFFIYGTAAALVFGHLFFPTADPTAALVASFATFGVAYLARPIGGVVMSHFGDRIGRKRILLISLLIMGAASVAIGLLPTYDQVGALAPVLLVALRLVQGFSAGAEAAGASTLTVEQAPTGRRAFYASWVMSGFAAGTVLAVLVFIPIAALPQDQLETWGWRIPFLASVVMLGLAYWVRTRLHEPEVFEKTQEDHKTVAIPALQVLRGQGGDVLRVGLMTLMAATQTIFSVFGIAYASSAAVGMPRTTILVVNAVTVGLSILVMPFTATLSDRIGRRPVLLIGSIGCLITMPVYFLSISTGNVAFVFAAGIVTMSLIYSFWNAVWPAYYAELFATPVRFTGMAIGNQAGLIVVGFAPAIGGLLLKPGINGWVPVAIFAAALMAIATVAVLKSRETYHVPIDQLGKPAVTAETQSLAVKGS